MPSSTAESTTWEAERAELRAVIESPVFSRSPTLSHLLSYLCEKTFAGETDQIKEYSVALDVFDRRDSFDQDTDSIVRVEANRLRKRLSEYYAADGANHYLHITIPVGQYVPQFHRANIPEQVEAAAGGKSRAPDCGLAKRPPARFLFFAIATVVVAAVGVVFFVRGRGKMPALAPTSYAQPSSQPSVGLPVGEEMHILAGSNRKYVDHAGKLWRPDNFFSGGNAVASPVQHIWRTQDPIIYRNSRQGDFAYDIPLRSGLYELHLHFAETFYGPENSGGGGEGSRTMTVSANGQVLLRHFDVLADAGDGRTAEVKIFEDISPAADRQLHLTFSGERGGAMVSAIEILPGVARHLRPVRIVARDVPYYSDDSRWWSPDVYFKGGQLAVSQQPALGTEDPEFYETERWGNFSYAIPVAPGRYSVTLHFIEHHAAGTADRAELSGAGVAESSQARVFNVFCNGRTVIDGLDIVRQVGENHPLVRKIKGLEPNAQGKLLLEFVPVTRYATVTAIEVAEE